MPNKLRQKKIIAALALCSVAPLVAAADLSGFFSSFFSGNSSSAPGGSAEPKSDPATNGRKDFALKAMASNIPPEQQEAQVRQMERESCDRMKTVTKNAKKEALQREAPIDPINIIRNRTCMLDIMSIHIPTTGYGFVDRLVGDFQQYLNGQGCERTNKFWQQVQEAAGKMDPRAMQEMLREKARDFEQRSRDHIVNELQPSFSQPSYSPPPPMPTVADIAKQYNEQGTLGQPVNMPEMMDIYLLDQDPSSFPPLPELKLCGYRPGKSIYVQPTDATNTFLPSFTTVKEEFTPTFKNRIVFAGVSTSFMTNGAPTNFWEQMSQRNNKVTITVESLDTISVNWQLVVTNRPCDFIPNSPGGNINSVGKNPSVSFRVGPTHKYLPPDQQGSKLPELAPNSKYYINVISANEQIPFKCIEQVNACRFKIKIDNQTFYTEHNYGGN